MYKIPTNVLRISENLLKSDSFFVIVFFVVSFAECTNELVTVNIAVSTISCMFLDNYNSSTAKQSCSIMYWQCDQGGMRNIQNYDLSNNAELMLTTSGYYCYVVTAIYGSHTVRIEGNISKES